MPLLLALFWSAASLGGPASRIHERALRGLPSRAGSVTDFARLAPGSSVGSDPLAFHGQKAIDTDVTVDGADFVSPFLGGPRGGEAAAFTVDPDAVREIAVAAAAPAESGRAAASFLRVATRAGTDDGHGGARFHVTPGSDHSGQRFGVKLGGPIRKDRLFYFAAADVQRDRSTGQADRTRIEPRVVDALAALGSPDENGPIERTSDARAVLARLDWRASPRDVLTLRYQHAWSERKSGLFDVDSWGRSANGTDRASFHAVTGWAASRLSPTLHNRFRLQYSRESRPWLYDAPAVAVEARPLPDTAFDFDRGYRFGRPFFLPSDRVGDSVLVEESLGIVRGAHALAAGVEFRWARFVETAAPFAHGRYVFTSTDGFLAFLANPRHVECSDGSTSSIGTCPPGATVAGPVLLYRQHVGIAGTHSVAQSEPTFFVQDTWRPGPRWTVEYGVRWDAQVQPEPATPAADVLFAPLIGATSEGEAFPSDGTLPSEYRMFQPRVGIAWDPTANGKTVVRAGAGVYYARLPGRVVAAARSLDGSRGWIVSRSSRQGAVPPYPGLLTSTEADAARPDVFVFDEDFRNPRTYAASLAVERELLPDLAVQLRYLHMKGVHGTRLVDRNDPLLGDGVAPGPWTAGEPGIESLTTVESSGRSLYRGLTLDLHKRWSKGWEARANYTLAKSLSDDDGEGDPFSLRYAKVTDLAAEYGPSDRDRRHRLNAWLLWEPPGRAQVGVRYSYGSARPLSVTRDGRAARAPLDRVNPDGTVTRRNQGRKDDAFSALDLRLARPIRVGKRGALEPVLEVFNVLGATNVRRPEWTSLVLALDTSLATGPGEPRRVQLGLRYTW
jgi:hypothetical protein